MKYVTQGSQSAARLALLLQLTKIDSEDMIDALNDYLVKGLASSTAADINGVDRANLNRAANTINDMAAIVEAIKNLDYAGSYLSQLK
jgi:hypothetical protein